MLQPFDKWTVCFWDEHKEEAFEKFETKEEVLNFIDEEMMQNETPWSDFAVFPPYSSLSTSDLLSYGVPERFKQQIK